MSSKNRSITLDLAFGMDTTGSMRSYIEAATAGVRTVASEIEKAGVSDLRFALVEYKDHPVDSIAGTLLSWVLPDLDSSFVTRKHDFTSYVSTMKSWLSAATADGGGDRPEAVADALKDIRDLSWRSHATKVCVFITDAPPHGLGDDGPCRCGLDPLKLSRELAKKGVTLYMVGCEPEILDCKEFMTSLAYATGGQYVPLNDIESLVKVIIGGALEELSLAAPQSRVDDMVQNEVTSGCGFSIDAITSKIHGALLSENVQSKRLQFNNADLPGASATAIRFAGLPNVRATREDANKGASSSARDKEGVSCVGSGYSVSEGTVTKKQVHRMVMKSKARLN